MELQVLYQSSDSYAPLAGISIESLLYNNQQVETLHIYFLEDGISQSNKEKIEEIVHRYQRKISFFSLQPIQKILQNYELEPFKGSYATYCKLFAPSYLDLWEGRLLYIDCDTIIEDSIVPLWELEMGESVAACRLELISDEYKRLIHMPVEQLYYNAGVILFDLNNWRKYHCEQSLLDVLRKDRVRYFTADQDILNLVLGEKMMPLALRYNFPTTMLMFSPEEIYRIYDLHENRFYTIEQMKKALDEPGIHHMGLYFGLRPWNGGEDHPQRAVYEKISQ